MTDRDDEALFPLLDAYVEALHRDDDTACRQLLLEHPELQPVVDCLTTLDSIAPPRDEPEPELARGADATTPWEGVEHAAAGKPELPYEFGQYELLDEIGRGGMGVVYRARQKNLDRVVAVKMILVNHLATPDHVRRFLLEAKAAAAVRHPNIVSVIEAGQHHGQHYFAMEHVAGENLADRLRREPLDPTAAARLVLEIAQAVEHLHQQGIVHRDLKPSNVLLDAAGRPLVNDFGLAKLFSDDGDATRSGVIVGTPSYMAPEQAAGRPADSGPWSDVYSLGAMLYEMLAGQPPFRAENPLDTLVQVLEREPTPPRRLNAKVPGDLERICLRCLEKNPAARYGSAAALAADLERFLRGEPVAALDAGSWRRVWRWMRREPALASHLGAMLCFYAIELANYHLFRAIDRPFHVKMSLVIGLWAAVSVVFQRRLGRRFIPAEIAWCLIDALAVTAVLYTADGAASPLVVMYPLLVVGSGLWFRVSLVWTTTCLALASYGLLVADFYFNRTELHAHFDTAFDRPVMFALMLAVLGCVVAYQVHRVRALHRYFERRVG